MMKAAGRQKVLGEEDTTDQVKLQNGGKKCQ